LRCCDDEVEEDVEEEAEAAVCPLSSLPVRVMCDKAADDEVRLEKPVSCRRTSACGWCSPGGSGMPKGAGM
jgi:hypothetical protein